MSDPHHDEKPATGGGGVDIKAYLKFFYFLLTLILVFVFSFLIVFVNEQTAQNFINFLNGLEIIMVIYFVFLIFKFFNFKHRFDHMVHEIHHRAQPHHQEHDGSHDQKEVPLTPIQKKFKNAIEQINSKYEEEWKIGVIELDSILKLLLIERGYEGGNVENLLSDGLHKGLNQVRAALEGHKVRNKIVREGLKYKLSKKDADTVLTNFTLIFRELGLDLPSKKTDNHH